MKWWRFQLRNLHRIVFFWDSRRNGKLRELVYFSGMIHKRVVKTKVPSSDIQPTIARDTRWILQGWHIFVSSLCQQVVIFASFLESFHLSKPHGTASTAKRSEVVSNNGCKKRDQVNNPPYLNLSIHCWWCDSTMLKVPLMSCSPLRHHVASCTPA